MLLPWCTRSSESAVSYMTLWDQTGQIARRVLISVDCMPPLSTYPTVEVYCLDV